MHVSFAASKIVEAPPTFGQLAKGDAFTLPNGSYHLYMRVTVCSTPKLSGYTNAIRLNDGEPMCFKEEEIVCTRPHALVRVNGD